MSHTTALINFITTAYEEDIIEEEEEEEPGYTLLEDIMEDGGLSFFRRNNNTNTPKPTLDTALPDLIKSIRTVITRMEDEIKKREENKTKE